MKLIPLLVTTALIASPVLAQSSKDTMPGMGDQKMQGMESNAKAMNDADQDFMAAMHKMNQDMMQADDSDPGEAWMKKMIEHHKGAIEMSRIVLKHSKDKDVQKEANKTIEENEKSVKELQAKLKKKS